MHCAGKLEFIQVHEQVHTLCTNAQIRVSYVHIHGCAGNNEFIHYLQDGQELVAGRPVARWSLN